MEQTILIFMYILTTTLGVLVSLKLLGFKNTGYLGALIGIANGINDYFIKEILVSKAHFISGLHLITGIIVVFLLCYWLLRIRSLLGLLIPVLGYVVTALSEIMILLFIIVLFDKSFITNALTNINNQIIIGAITQFPILVFYLFLNFKYKEVTIYNLNKKIMEKRGK